jgi:hypothetical protein
VNNYLGRVYQSQGDYRRALDCLGQTVTALEGARRHERFGQFLLPAMSSRCWLAWCHAELGTFAAGAALGEEGLRIAEAVDHLASLMFAAWGVGLLALRQGALPARTGPAHLSGSGPPALFSQGGGDFGGSIYPRWPCRRRPATAHAGSGTGTDYGNGRLSSAL